MSFLSSYFGIADNSPHNQAVHCPFLHHMASGETYLENRPSAHVDTMKKVFHCKACGKGLSENQFIQDVFGCDYIAARKLQVAFSRNTPMEGFEAMFPLTKETRARAQSLGISDTVIQELKIRTTPYKLQNDIIAFPVEMYGENLDIRSYNPGHTPKMLSQDESMVGLIIPFQALLDTPDDMPIFLCAGEKDMALARTHGLNAITITGGEMMLPICPKLFAKKKVIILYDNDDAGRNGAIKIANYLYNYTDKIKVVTNFHEICKEKGEDITDFFMKYNQNVNALMRYIQQTSYFKPTEITKIKALDIVNLYQATQPEYLNKLVKTPIQVVGVEDRAFKCPITVMAEKLKPMNTENQAPLKNIIPVGTVRDWRLKEDNIEDLLHLVDENFKKDKIIENLKNLMRIPLSEERISVKELSFDTVYKVSVIDLYESGNDDIRPMEFNCFVIGQRLESGKKYLVTHKMTPHPYHGQQLTMVITSVEESNDSITTFKLNNEVISHLRTFQNKTYVEIAEKMKANIGFDVSSKLLHTIDLAYHTPLMFNFGERNQNIRATLDTLVISESRVGKSTTAQALQKVYGLGMFISLAGNAATIAGLVGGSTKIGTSNNFQTRAGIIPQNHRGLLVLEELGKANNDLLKELTDIRSSSQVRITRVSGSIALPAMLRMISLTNPKPRNNIIKPINAYPNGISIVTELVSKPEDIARYDIIHVVADKGAETIDPLWKPETPFTTEEYRTRIKWIWSRKAEQIVISEEVQKFIIERSNDLNKVYGTHIKIFGTETWKKLTRVAIAIAGYTVSTDASFENIIVTKTHINQAINYLIELYDNKVFRLKEFVDNERQYSTLDNDAIAVLQDIYTKSSAIIQTLNTHPVCSQNTLSLSSGVDRVDLNKIVQRLVRAYFVRFDGNDIVPTERYRMASEQINTRVIIDRVGENVVINNNQEVEDDF